ncbi:MAG TPA: hypothetical protein VGI60_17855 [Chthoniobacterales bacterium]
MGTFTGTATATRIELRNTFDSADSSGLEHGILVQVDTSGSNYSRGGTIPQRQPSVLAPVKSLDGQVQRVEPAL